MKTDFFAISLFEMLCGDVGEGGGSELKQSHNKSVIGAQYLFVYRH